MKKWLGLLLFFSAKVMAAFNQPVSHGVGKLATTMMDPVTFASDFIYTGCLIVGGSFVIGSLVKYSEYRRNPFATPLSTVIFLLICGLLLLSLPFFHYLVNYGTTYTLFK